jgi:hypothetical protein
MRALLRRRKPLRSATAGASKLHGLAGHNDGVCFARLPDEEVIDG